LIEQINTAGFAMRLAKVNHKATLAFSK